MSAVGLAAAQKSMRDIESESYRLSTCERCICITRILASSRPIERERESYVASPGSRMNHHHRRRRSIPAPTSQPTLVAPCKHHHSPILPLSLLFFAGHESIYIYIPSSSFRLVSPRVAIYKRRLRRRRHHI